MTDIVEQLRYGRETMAVAHGLNVDDHAWNKDILKMIGNAATEIERLRQELDELHSGDRVVLPHTLKHAQDLYTVAASAIEQMPPTGDKAND